MDTTYLSNLAQIFQTKTENLSLIMGPEELRMVLKTATPDAFLNPSAAFKINLHTHSTASDGQVAPADFLDSIQDEMQQTKTKQMIVALTDHDSVEGLPILLEKIIQSPKKYQSIRLVLGCELSTAYSNQDTLLPVDFEVLYYGVNPFDLKLNQMLQRLQNTRKKAVPIVLKELQKRYPAVNLNQEELLHTRKNLNLQKGLGCNFPYNFYSYVLEKDKTKKDDLRNYLFSAELDKQLHILNPIENILNLHKQDKSSLLSVAHPPRIALNYRLGTDFIERTQARQFNPGLTFIWEFLTYLYDNGVEALELYYGHFSGDLKVAFENLIQNKPAQSDTEKWIENFWHFSQTHQMLLTGGYDSHKNIFTKDTP